MPNLRNHNCSNWPNSSPHRATNHAASPSPAYWRSRQARRRSKGAAREGPSNGLLLRLARQTEESGLAKNMSGYNAVCRVMIEVVILLGIACWHRFVASCGEITLITSVMSLCHAVWHVSLWKNVASC